MTAFLLLLLHLVGASVWVGGHLVLLIAVLPGALRRRDPGPVQRFEKPFERVGVPAVLVQVVTGALLAHRYVPGILPAFQLADPLQRAVALKLILIGLTVILGLHARIRLVPRLDPKRLPLLALHVVLITFIALLLLASGAFIHSGAAIQGA